MGLSSKVNAGFLASILGTTLLWIAPGSGNAQVVPAADTAYNRLQTKHLVRQVHYRSDSKAHRRGYSRNSFRSNHHSTPRYRPNTYRSNKYRSSKYRYNNRYNNNRYAKPYRYSKRRYYR